MTLRLFPWAAIALLVLGIAVRSAFTAKPSPAPAGEAHGELSGSGPEIRVGPVDVREFHDDGTWNRLDAQGAIYGYADRTVSAWTVTVLVGEGARFAGTTVRAPRATWNLDGKTITLPGGCRAEANGGWTGDLSASTLDLAGSILRVPGPARIEGPGISVLGKNLAWRWAEGRITMESTTSRISPTLASGRKG